MLRDPPLRVALLCSRRAPGLEFLLDRDPRRGKIYDIVALVTSDPECTAHVRSGDGPPLLVNDIRAFYTRAGTRLSDLGPRPDYDRGTVRLLEPFKPDLVVLCGYLHIVTPPLLDAYSGRMVNIHDSDLPRYPGLHATRDAVIAGERETRSSVHVVVPEVDAGPGLFRSWPFPVHELVDAARREGKTDILKAYAYAQREWMMVASWGPLLAAAIDAFAHDRVRVRNGGTLVAGLPGPRDLRPEEDWWSRGAGVPPVASVA